MGLESEVPMASDLKTRMFIPVDDSEMCLDLDKMDADIRIRDATGNDHQWHGQAAHMIIFKIKGGFQPTHGLIETLESVCGEAGAEAVCREIRRQSCIQIFSKAIL